MRVLILTNAFPSPWFPTKGTYNFELARSLSSRNKVTVVAPVPWFDELRQAPRVSSQMRSDRWETRDGVSIHFPRYYYLPKIGRRWSHWFLWRSVHSTLFGTLREFRPDAVVGYWTHPDGTVAVNYARRVGAAAFIMVGGSDVLLSVRDSRSQQTIAETLQSADGVIVVSADLRKRVVKLGVSPERVHVVYRGVDRARFVMGDRSAARARLGISHEKPIFLWVGRMVPVKGLDNLLQAADRLRQRGCRFELVLAGDGSERSRLEQTAASLGLKEVVRFVGQIAHADLPDWYRAADWTVLTSHSEGVPNVLLESHACGTPFIATRVGGVTEIAVDGVDRIVPPADPNSLADQMADAMGADPVDRETLASRVSGLEAAAEAISRLIERVVNERRTILPASAGATPVVCQ